MEDSSLKTASTYVNNLLLARGLLRNGTPVDFAALLHTSSTRTDHNREARPEKKQRSEAKGSSEVAVQVINLVHDLILRRDVCINLLALPYMKWRKTTLLCTLLARLDD